MDKTYLIKPEDATGRVVDSITETYCGESLCIKFKCGSAVIFYAKESYGDAEIEIGTEENLYESEAIELGFYTEEEVYAKKQKEIEEKKSRVDANRRRQYEELKKEFGDE